MSTWQQYREANGLPRATAQYLRTEPRVWLKRATNRWHDLSATLAGYCNHSPYSGIPGGGGGYAHWRCALQRGHDGMHRYRNYVWAADGRTDYLPVPDWREMPRQPRERSMTMTRRQARQREQWLNRRYADRSKSRTP